MSNAILVIVIWNLGAIALWVSIFYRFKKIFTYLEDSRDKWERLASEFEYLMNKRIAEVANLKRENQVRDVIERVEHIMGKRRCVKKDIEKLEADKRTLLTVLNKENRDKYNLEKQDD